MPYMTCAMFILSGVMSPRLSVPGSSGTCANRTGSISCGPKYSSGRSREYSDWCSAFSDICIVLSMSYSSYSFLSLCRLCLSRSILYCLYMSSMRCPMMLRERSMASDAEPRMLSVSSFLRKLNAPLTKSITPVSLSALFISFMISSSESAVSLTRAVFQAVLSKLAPLYVVCWPEACLIISSAAANSFATAPSTSLNMSPRISYALPFCLMCSAMLLNESEFLPKNVFVISSPICFTTSSFVTPGQ